jgi:predicted nucleic acid-binding protein
MISAPADIETVVLAELAADLGQFQLDPSIADLLFTDVSITFAGLSRFGILDVVDRQRLARPAFLISTLHGIAYEDALVVVLAEGSGEPLLLADDKLHDQFMALQAQRPNLQIAWLPDLRDS